MTNLVKNWPTRYPADELANNFSFNEGQSLSNFVWDIEHGTLLTLGKNCEISSAILGSEKLSDDKVKQIYGTPPVFGFLRNSSRESQMRGAKGDYLTFNGLFQ